jgi:hypothetical protein
MFGNVGTGEKRFSVQSLLRLAIDNLFKGVLDDLKRFLFSRGFMGDRNHDAASQELDRNRQDARDGSARCVG